MTRKAHSIGRLYVVFGAPQAGGSRGFPFCVFDRAHTVERDGLRRFGRGFLMRLTFWTPRATDWTLTFGIWGEPGSAAHINAPSSGPGYGEAAAP